MPLDTAEPAVTAPAFDDRWRSWIGENLLFGSTPEHLRAVLAQNGFTSEQVEAEIAAAAASPYLKSSTRLANRIAKRDWQLAILSKLADQDVRLRSVPRRDKLTPEQFRDEHFLLNRPVVMTGLIDHWPALQRWSLDYLEHTLGERFLELQQGRDANPTYERDLEPQRWVSPLSDILARLRSGEPSNDYYVTANNGAANQQALAPLWADIGTIPGILQPSGGNDGFLWLGPAGTVTPFHHDLTNNLLVQAMGRKRVYLVPSWHTPKMRNFLHCFSDWTPADLAAGGADRPPMLEVEIGPGDVLFLPVGWWHEVHGLTTSMSLTFTNFVWSNDHYSDYTGKGPV